MISICNKPRKPHLKPKPNAAEVSASKLKDESFNDSFSNASLRSLKSALSVGKRPQKTTGIEGLKPSNIEFVGFLSSVIVSPTLQSATVLTEAVKKPISPGPIDSTFNINFPDDIGHILIEHNIVENNETHTLELFKIYAYDDLNNHRFPDGGKWIKTDKNTFGSKNIDKISGMDADLIPELFVLYQNYPNPFNSKTRISFDLLQDATLSLYVTDATGRIKTTFSDKEFYNSGKYNFDWNAESFSTGVYFFTINAEVEGYLPILFSRKMIYLK